MRECLEMIERLREDLSYRNIFAIMCAQGNRVAAEYLDAKGTVHKRTYAEYGTMVRRAAFSLQKRLPEMQGRYVGIKLENTAFWPVALWGTLMAGMKPLLLDVRGKEDTTVYLLEQADAAAIITEQEFSDPRFKVLGKDQIMAEEPPQGWEEAWADEIALCTSGTTQSARVYVYDGKAMSNQIASAQYFLKENGDIMYDELDGELKNLAFLPFHHIFGFVAVYLWFSFFGKTIVYLKDKNPQTIMEACRIHGVTHIFCVPLFWNNVAQGLMRKVKLEGEKKLQMFEKMCETSLNIQSVFKEQGRKFVSSTMFRGIQQKMLGNKVRFLISGGGHVLPETLRLLNAVGYPLYNGFGMTETGITSVELSYSVKDRMSGSVGKPFETVEYKIVPKDEDAEIGELLISGESIHSGKMENGTFIKNKNEKGNWFSTGDIARIEDGRLFIEGRLKEVIINESGENIYPDELEDAFVHLNGVSQLCIFGAQLGGKYEQTAMVVELESGNIATLAEEINNRNAKLPMYKKVQRVYIAGEPLPVANGIKVQRQKLKTMLEQEKFSARELDLKTGDYVEHAAAEEIKQAETPQQKSDELEKIKQTVRQIFAEVLILEEEEIGDTDHFVFDLGGDSLSVIGVMAQLEEKYNLFIPDEEFSNAVNVNEVAQMIYDHLYQKGTAEKKKEEPKRRERITEFEQTEEWKEFAQRKAEMTQTGNPYFVAHEGLIRATSVVNGKEVINMGSYNYLGLSGHPETVEAACKAAREYGTSATGSRTLAGEKRLYQELEEEIAKWKHTEASIVLNGGHATNVTIVGNFCKEGDLILYDALSHNSIVQGCELSKATHKAFPHNDIAALEGILQNSRDQYEKVLLVVEGVYSMDGDIAPIPEFVRLKKKYGLFLMVDEAHSSGVIGEHGGGVDDYFGLAPDDIDLKMGTLSKALGTCGGYIAGKKNLIEYLHYNLPGFVFSVGISPPLAAACRKGVQLIQQDQEIVGQLHKNIALFMKLAREKGFNTCLAGESAIIPVMIGRDEDACMVSNEMLGEGIFVPPAVFPAVAKGKARLRFSLNAAHTSEQIEKAVDVLDKILEKHGLK